MCYTPITAQVIGAARRLKGIVEYGVGIDAIDIAAAMRRGHPGGQRAGVRRGDGCRGRLRADDRAGQATLPAIAGAVARRLDLARAALAGQRHCRQDRSAMSGLGRIGRSMASHGASRGTSAPGVLAFDHASTPLPCGVGRREKVDHLPELLAASDFVSRSHCVAERPDPRT